MRLSYISLIISVAINFALPQAVSQDEWTEKVESILEQENQPTEDIYHQSSELNYSDTLTTTESTPYPTKSETRTGEIKFFGDYTVEDGQVVYDKVRVIGGDLYVFGTVLGQVAVVGGDIYLKPTAVIDGQVIAIGGSVHKEPGATINGKVVETNLKGGLIYREIEGNSKIYGRSDFKLEEQSERRRQSWIHPKIYWFIYNRNEGLLLTPFNFKWDRKSLSSFRVNMSLGYRFGQDTWAGKFTLEKSFFPNHNVILYTNFFRMSRSDDYYRLPEIENSLAAFLGRQDFYDRWDEQGVSIGFGIDLSLLKIKARMASVEQFPIPVVDDIWSLFEKNRSLRSNRLIEDTLQVNFYEGSLAFRTSHFHPLETGCALYLNTELYQDTDESSSIFAPKNSKLIHRYLGMALINWEFSEGLVLRTRIMGGTSKGDLDSFREFGVGGLGSVSAYPYKIQTGNQFVQANLELVLKPEFLDEDWSLKVFADAGHAWYKDKDKYNLGGFFKSLDEGIASAGIGIGSEDDDGLGIGLNIARPLDGPDYWETTIRLNYNF